MSESLPYPVILGLTAVAFLAGTIDAVAGGGGLLTVPALMAAGLPPHTVFGTNKGSAVFGSGAALLRFSRGGLIDWGLGRWLFPLGFLGSLGGAALLMLLEPAVLKPLVLVLLIAAAIIVLLVRPSPRPAASANFAGAALVALGTGAYDGFFGPGTGTFLIVGFIGVLGLTLPQASALAKVVNFASNLAALALLASQGVVVWAISLPMALGQLLGGTLGAHLAIRGGAKLIRGAVLLVVSALVVKLARDLW